MSSSSGKLVLLLVLFVITQSMALADQNAEHKLLRLKSFNNGACVSVEQIPQDALAFGISAEKIKNQVELKLMQNGIKVLTFEQANSTDYLYAPIVFVQLCALENEGRGLAYSLKISVSARAVLASDVVKLLGTPGGPTSAQFGHSLCTVDLWDTDILGLAGRKRLPEAIYTDIADKTDALMHDYLLAKQVNEGN